MPGKLVHWGLTPTGKQMSEKTVSTDRFFALDEGDYLNADICRKVLSRGDTLRLKVDGHDMSPFIRNGDIVQVKSASVQNLRVGDVVLYRHGEDFFVHRVVKRQTSDGRIGLVTKGDATADGGGSESVYAEQILGKVVAVQKPGKTIRLECTHWKYLNHFIAKVSVYSSLWQPMLKMIEITSKLLHPFPVPIALGEADEILRGVAEKYDEAGEVAFHSRIASEGFEEWEADVLKRFMRRKGRILDVGCGAGREAIAFAKTGFEVVGIDVAPEMIGRAIENVRKEKLNVSFETKSATEIDYPPESFDYIFFSRGIYSCIPRRSNRIKVLKDIRKILKPGGLVIFSVLYYRPKRFSRTYLVNVLRKLIGFLMAERFKSEPGDTLISNVSPASDLQRTCFAHLFSGPDEVLGEVKAAGLSVIEGKNSGFWVAKR